MYLCHYIESYHDRLGRRVSVFQRGNYRYELSQGAKHLRWFDDMSLDDVRRCLEAEGYVPCESD